ncbi:MAG: DUF2238 domain-containing protein [Nitrosarchaeum sp.]|nr:DUF2238 domain-containing protein [Nitrosarchaeum sp.]
MSHANARENNLPMPPAPAPRQLPREGVHTPLAARDDARTPLHRSIPLHHTTHQHKLKICIALFLLLHTYAVFYAYHPPIGNLDLLSELFGTTRNHFDRIVHLSFGLLLTPAVRDVQTRVTPGLTGLYTALVVLALSAGYELLEWLAAVIFANGAIAFIGMQGDIWDSHIDMLLAVLGCLIAMGIQLGSHTILRRIEHRTTHGIKDTP